MFIIFFLKLVSVCMCGLIDAPSCKFEDKTIMSCNHIPDDIVPGTLRIRVTNMRFATDMVPMYVSKSNFSKQEWSSLEYLEINDFKSSINGKWYFEDACFSRLEALKELHIQTTHVNIAEDVFTGIKKVTVLDLSHCAALGMETLLQALTGMNKLPELRTLILKDWGSHRIAYSIDERFVKTLFPRKLSHLDISNNQIANIDISLITTYFKDLQILNISYAIIADVTNYEKEESYDLEHFRVFDVSHAVFPRYMLNNMKFARVFKNIQTTISSTNIGSASVLFSANTLNMSELFPHYAPVYLDNVTIYIDEHINWFVQTIIMQQNNIKRLNVKLFCENFTLTSIKHFDFSYNDMDFIHPSFIKCIPNLRIIDLSYNSLYKMVVENNASFEILFQGHSSLEKIKLSSNNLNEIPKNTFIDCKNLRVIDVSNNRLSQITFKLNGLLLLRRLDLHENNIKTLDHISINRLNVIWFGKKWNETNLIITSNPLSCSECSSKHFLTWLISKMESEHKIQSDLCLDEDGNKKEITKKTIESVQKICERKGIIISSIVVTTAFLSIFLLTFLIIYKRKKHLKKKRIRHKLINRLRQDQDEFVTFLSYSSDDSEFVENNIVSQLDECLQHATGVERKLVCTGDEHFRPGAYVHDEIDRCFNVSSVVIVVISNNFFDSDYCCKEFEQACVMDKPIILMLLGNVDVERMSPRMQELYKRNVRILWEYAENGGYVMKTTWANVCNSILERAVLGQN